jgi:excisionase family DNA binding protein
MIRRGFGIVVHRPVQGIEDAQPAREASAQSTTTAPATISMHEAAQILGVNVKTLYAEANAGRFPVLRFGRTMRISRSVLDAILARGSIA